MNPVLIFMFAAQQIMAKYRIMLIRHIISEDTAGTLAGEIFDPRNSQTYPQPRKVRVPHNDVTPRNPALSPTSGVIMRKDPMIQAPLDPVFEVLNSPVQFTWHTLSRDYGSKGGDEAQFQVDGVGYRVDFMNGTWNSRPCVTLQYSIDKASMQKLGRQDLTGPTGLGVPLPVLSTILSSVQAWFSQHKPPLVFFYDADKKASRARFYQRAANMLMSQYGYQIDPETEPTRRKMGSNSIWLLSLPQPNL